MPLNEKCGVIEWVPHTTTMKAVIREIEPEYSLPVCFISVIWFDVVIFVV